jgi:hypothetical protein
VPGSARRTEMAHGDGHRFDRFRHRRAASCHPRRTPSARTPPST